jgi:hypothetical protein
VCVISKPQQYDGPGPSWVAPRKKAFIVMKPISPPANDTFGPPAKYICSSYTEKSVYLSRGRFGTKRANGCDGVNDLTSVHFPDIPAWFARSVVLTKCMVVFLIIFRPSIPVIIVFFTNLMQKSFIIYFNTSIICLYMFRAYLRSSSGGQNCTSVASGVNTLEISEWSKLLKCFKMCSLLYYYK